MFSRGVRLGVDVGTARIGVARSDPDGVLAVPVETVSRNDDAQQRLYELAEEYNAVEFIVGLPRSLSGAETQSTRDARAFAQALSHFGNIPVNFWDERLSTVSAQAQLRDAGRSQRSSRKVVDQAAAVVFLQNALDRYRADPGRNDDGHGIASS